MTLKYSLRTKNKTKRRKSRNSAIINFIIENYNEERNAWMKELLKLKDIFVDGIIETSDHKKLKVNRIALAACSKYFKALFSNILCPECQIREVFLPDISSNIMKIIIKYIYTGKLNGLTLDNIVSFIKAADRLQVTGALDYCHQFLINQINIENCIKILKLAQLFYAPNVIKAANLFILYNFSIIWKESQDYLQLNHDELGKILADDRLNVQREESSYSALINWTSYDKKRGEHFGKLLKLIRFGNSSSSFIQSTVCQNVFIKSNDELQNYIDSIVATITDIETDPVPSKFNIKLHPFLRPRIPKDILFVFGGWSSSHATNILETYDCRVNKWFIVETVNENILPMIPHRAYHGMIYFNGLIYIIGGFDGRKYYNSVKAFDPTSKIWMNRACMNTARCYVSVALCNGYIYAMGGFDGNLRTNSAERYDHDTNQWEFIANMHYQRSDASAASLKGMIYIFGGFNGMEVLRSGEVYDPSTNDWSLINAMNQPRSGVQLVAYNDFIYAMGGNDGNTRQSSVERYDPQEDYWTMMSEMKIARSNFACALLEGLIYVIGGYNGFTTINNVEAYDPITDYWMSIWKMNINRSALSACVVSELENGQEYTWLNRQPKSNVSTTQSIHFSSLRSI